MRLGLSSLHCFQLWPCSFPQPHEWLSDRIKFECRRLSTLLHRFFFRSSVLFTFFAPSILVLVFLFPRPWLFLSIAFGCGLFCPLIIFGPLLFCLFMLNFFVPLCSCQIEFSFLSVFKRLAFFSMFSLKFSQVPILD